MSNKTLPLSLVLMSALLPASASSNEEVPANEDAATQQIVQMIEESVRAEAKNGLARRGAHAKAHGCVQAEFRVLDNLPEEVRVGIFRDPRVYPAWIRYSNAFGKMQDDSVGDARGMAIKLMGVERSESGTQDFVMINHPVFLVRNAADYVEFQKALSEDRPVKFFFPSLNPFNFRLHEFGIANAIRSAKVSQKNTCETELSPCGSAHRLWIFLKDADFFEPLGCSKEQIWIQFVRLPHGGAALLMGRITSVSTFICR